MRLLQPAKLSRCGTVGQHTDQIVQNGNVDQAMNSVEKLIGGRKQAVHRDAIMQGLSDKAVHDRRFRRMRPLYLHVSEPVIAETRVPGFDAMAVKNIGEGSPGLPEFHLRCSV